MHHVTVVSDCRGLRAGGKRTALIAWLVACCALIVAAFPALAQAQYEAPPPDPGFEYIFDGTATGSDASFDKWIFASDTIAGSAAQNRWTLNPDEGAMDPNDSPFGAIWYPVKPFGNATLKLKYMVEDSPTATRNGGVMIRAPEVRYQGSNAEVLAAKPIGYSYKVCPGALEICGLTEPAPSETYFWEGADGPFPPASDAEDPENPFLYTGPYCARSSNSVDPPLPNNVLQFDSTTQLVMNGTNANNHQHWTQVYCGHEIQINETLTGGGPNPSTDPRKTGSVYGFQDLNAAQSRTYERLEKGVWHEMEIRMIGQQFTVLIDGKVINQFDNAIPRVASRAGDPPTVARQQPAGYIGFQSHGGNDRIWYKEVQVREYSEAEIPENVEPPSVTGNPTVGKQLTCHKGVWDLPKASYTYSWFRANPIADHPRFRAPSQEDLGNRVTPPHPDGLYGTDNLTWLGPEHIKDGRKYVLTEEDVGKVVYCQVSATRNHATTWAYASAPQVGRDVPVNVTPPTLVGSGRVGTMLTCERGEWTGGGSYSYEWLLDGEGVEVGTGPGQTGSNNPKRFRAQESQVGSEVVCVVTRHGPKGDSDPVASNAVEIVPRD
ncbi:MAG TPA: DUF1080 domain-containing protein [Solirubrobacterales bacterium]|jgi:hypothetical protein